MAHRRQRALCIVAVAILSSFQGHTLFAEAVDTAQIRQAADTFLKVRAPQPARGSGTLSAASAKGVSAAGPAAAGTRELRDGDGTLLAYVTDLEPRGFVVLSADTGITPVIAYSFRSNFPRGREEDHPLYRMLREDMRQRIRALAEHPELKSVEAGELWDFYIGVQAGEPNEGAFQQWPPEGTTATGGWLETMWDQKPPYNAFCPLDPVDGTRTYVGCVATAFAQIVHYHKRCDIRFGPADAYTSEYGIDVDAESARYDFPSFAELNGYLAAIQGKYLAGTELDTTDIAALGFACGVAVQMDYSSKGSGARTEEIADVLVGRFNYYSADVTGGLPCELYCVLQENMVNGLPALLTIREPNAHRGHAIICDGYNTDDEYHLNFGWGVERPAAMTEAWYRLPVDVPSFLNVLTGAILNIRLEAPAVAVEPGRLRFHGLPGQESEPQILRIEANRPDSAIRAIRSSGEFLIADANDVAYSHDIEYGESDLAAGDRLIHVKFCPGSPGGFYGLLRIECERGQMTQVVLTGNSYEGGTQIPGGPATGRWTQAESPYFVSGDIVVPADGLLLIDPGTKVIFVGPYSMTVGNRARLAAMGTSNGPVEFTAWNATEGWAGLRFLDSGDDDILRHCTITLSRKGSGIVVRDPNESDDEAMLDEGRDPNSAGGAIYCHQSDPRIINCKIINNVGDFGGAIYCHESSPAITNTVIANNQSSGGSPQCGGLYAELGGRTEIKNCTIVNNSPGGLFSGSWDGMAMTNTIVWGNKHYQTQVYQSDLAASFCDIQGGFQGRGNIDADPCFLTPSPGVGIDCDGSAAIWMLRNSSPCVNAGTEVDLPTADLAGYPRIASGIIDIGAYENQAGLPLITVTPSATLDAGYIRIGTSSTTSLEIRNTGRMDFTIESLGIADANSAFSVLTDIKDRVLAPGESVHVEVAFAPARETIYSGTLNICSTASNGPHKPVTLRGVGVAGTVVPPGPVSGAWVTTESPYAITGDILIPMGHALTIDPGVTVKFAGHFSLTVGFGATLEAIGTKDQGIVFTATDTNDGWFGIRFVNSEEDDVMQYCTVEYARKPMTSGGGFFNLMGGGILCCGSPDAAPGFYVPSSPWIDHCRIARNHAEFGGGIMITDNSDAWITHCDVVDNSSDTYGAGILVYGARGILANNVVAHNSGYVSGGITNWYSLPLITNNTIVHNRPNGLYLEATEMSVYGAVPIVNNIVWQNEMYVEESVWPSEYSIRFNDIQGGWRGQGNIDADPLFADPNNRDYHLKSQAGRWDPNTDDWVIDDVTSPCIDAGDPDSPADGEPLPNGNRLNMGAYGGTAEASKSP